MNMIREHVFLAALLHNICEFYQRTGKPSDEIFNRFPRRIVESMNMKSQEKAVILLANQWSCGGKINMECDVAANALSSIFNSINIENGVKGKYSHVFGLSPLGLGEYACFPIDSKSGFISPSESDYSSLWDSFVTEMESLPLDSFSGFSESLLSLLKKYLWCVPSSTMVNGDVCLYDHMKTTAAFADCLYMYGKDYPGDFQVQNDTLILSDGIKPVLLVGCDLSGIQKFLYNISSRKAASSLKGRSFYLQLLVDSIIQRIIKHPEIKASYAHIVYSSGGKFYMLLPNTENVKIALMEIASAVEEEMWREHYGHLSVNFDFVPFGYVMGCGEVMFGDNGRGNISLLWKSLADSLAMKKNNKFKDLLLDKYSDFFDVQTVGGNKKVCAVTGIESENCVCLTTGETNDGDIVWVLPSVKKHADLGTTLKDVDYIITYRTDKEKQFLSDSTKIDIKIAGMHNYLFDQKELVDNNSEFRKIASADTCVVKRINDCDFLRTTLKGMACSYGFQFYGGNRQAQINGRNKTFEELADGSYLGILRMDVDNLSSIFINGISSDSMSFSSYSTLSFMLDYFFSGYLNTIREKFKNDVNILYSGGDDVFAIGKWDRLIDFAAAVRRDFRKFVGRDDISISGGIAIVSDKFPISKAAEMAGEAEAKAKNDYGASKNAFNLFGETVSWVDEFDYVEKYKKIFVEAVSTYNMPKGLLHKIMLFANIIKENKYKKASSKKEDLSYVWHTAYYLTRFIERQSNCDFVVDLCKDLRDRQLLDTRNYELMSVAARWAELELKN